MIEYRVYTKELNGWDLDEGFFEGWPAHPDQAVHRSILKDSFKSIVALDTDRKKIVGFINIISDGILSAYIPLLEVVPRYRNRGIGRKLAELALEETKDFYMVDLCCDETMTAFYEKFGMVPVRGMILRNPEKAMGRCTESTDRNC
ncbi:GNAT family N-acetyltransferase [Proteiniclasticum sp. QWL-01]|uniref:GNAT family N-acetyltransferase n=1 Tax=Proteiniclasticum sp. QWL-01 TaxID=3036945 RepID=UPI002410C002|nr:GNAT family N-acetyltransferase [Proteiniclasticum sp. QWL-01]WFF73712.1 GNAT family N-acetyltransferase [Proteiniclasticum sp. QWL-01]